MICAEGRTNDKFKTALNQAYKGEGDPVVRVISAKTSEMMVSHIKMLYAIEVPDVTPAKIMSLNLYDRLASARTSYRGSTMATKVTDTVAFPGGGSLEAKGLQQTVILANAAAVTDSRQTEINKYRLVEGKDNLTMTTEHLAETDNKHYHIARTVGLALPTPDRQNTRILYATELVVKNRIDSKRLQITLVNLAKATQIRMFHIITQAK